MTDILIGRHLVGVGEGWCSTRIGRLTDMRQDGEVLWVTGVCPVCGVQYVLSTTEDSLWGLERDAWIRQGVERGWSTQALSADWGMPYSMEELAMIDDGGSPKWIMVRVFETPEQGVAVMGGSPDDPYYDSTPDLDDENDEGFFGP